MTTSALNTVLSSGEHGGRETVQRYAVRRAMIAVIEDHLPSATALLRPTRKAVPT